MHILQFRGPEGATLVGQIRQLVLLFWSQVLQKMWHKERPKARLLQELRREIAVQPCFGIGTAESFPNMVSGLSPHVTVSPHSKSQRQQASLKGRR